MKMCLSMYKKLQLFTMTRKFCLEASIQCSKKTLSQNSIVNKTKSNLNKVKLNLNFEIR